VAAGVAIMVILLALGAVAFRSSKAESAAPVKPSPQVSASPIATASPIPTATPLPSATPSPSPTPDPVPIALEKARQTAPSDPAAALTILVELQKSNPVREDIRQSISEFLSAARLHHDTLTPGQIAALRKPLEEAAALDFVDAELLLGEQLRATDPKDALKWTLAAANNSNVEAMVLAGLMLSNGLGAEKPNLVEAATWFQRAAEAGDPRAMFALGECYLLSKGVTRDPKLALEWLDKAAAQNDVQALNKLGDLSYRGIPGVLEPDIKKAFWYFSSAKDLGYPDAYGNLGALFMKAPAGLRDEKMAVEIFKQGIDKGDARSMCFYAICLEDGVGGLAKDPDAARPWYVKAAEQGVAKAQEWCREHQVPFTPSTRPTR
jgi:TPR repeat protein